MYQKLTEGWLKHADFIILDVICLQIAYILSYAMRNGSWNPYSNSLYSDMSVLLVLLSVCIAFFSENHKNILRRGYLKEFKATLIQAAYLVACESIFLFLTKRSDAFSRGSFLFFIVLYPITMQSLESQTGQIRSTGAGIVRNSSKLWSWDTTLSI